MAAATMLAALATAPAASAQATAGTCQAKALAQAECGRLSVPLDHGDTSEAARRLGIAFVRFPAREARRGTVVFLAGGPGQAATPDAAAIARGPLRGLRSRYDLVFVDQRGTGASSPLTCTDAPKGVFRFARSATPAEIAAIVARCSAEVGDDRRFFSTYETTLDVEDVRVALGAEKIIPLGVSYGGQIAGEYARRFPDRVAAVVLDSTSPVEGLDALDRLPQLALPRVLREICFPPGCERVVGDPSRLLAGAVARLRRGALRGFVVLPSGRRQAATLRLTDLYALVRASDIDPALRTALPAALDAAARGDAAPALRLARAGSGGSKAQGVNDVRFLATACTEGGLPWSPESDPAGRAAVLQETLAGTEEAYRPFPVEAIASQVTAALCLGWAPTPRGPFPPAPEQGPAVPVLVLAGRDDLRTPLENQRRAAAQFPRARVQAIPNVGHSVLGSDASGCAQVSLRRFLAGASFGACVRGPREVPLALPAFRRVRDLPGVAGPLPRRVQRTAVAVDLTLRDVARQITTVAAGGGAGELSGSSVRVGGLRGGQLVLRKGGFVLRSYELVPGVRLTGTLGVRFRGRVTVTGTAATGGVTVRSSGSFIGTLGGTFVRYRPRPIGE